MPRDVHMRVKPICNPSLPSKRWGSPLLRKPIKGEQPLFSIMCRPRSSLFVKLSKGEYLLKYVHSIRHFYNPSSACSLYSRTDSCSIRFNNNHYCNNNIAGSLPCCHVAGGSTSRRDLFLLCSTASVLYRASHAN